MQGIINNKTTIKLKKFSIVLYTKSTNFLQVLLGIWAVLVILVNPLRAAVMPEYEKVQSIMANLDTPTAVAIDEDGNLYVVESRANRLLIYNSAGEYREALSGLQQPVSVAVGKDGRIFVGNSNTGNVEVYGPDLTLLHKLGLGDGEFTYPGSIVVDDAGKTYVVDSQEDEINVYHPDGSPHFSFGGTGNADGRFYFPTSIAIDEFSKELIVVDLQIVRSVFNTHEGARIQIFDMAGYFKRSFGEHGIGAGKLAQPIGIAVDIEGRIYVSDAYQNMIQVFSREGFFLGAITNPEYPLKTPSGIVVSDSNRLVIALLDASRVDIYRLTTPDDAIAVEYELPLAIPEPTSLCLWGMGIIGILMLERRKHKHHKHV